MVTNLLQIKVGALSASLVWGIIRHLQLLEQAAQPAAQYSWTHSPRIAVPPVPRAPVLALAPSGSSLLWGIAYWSTSLVFSLSAIVVAVVVKMAIREHRADLRRHGRPLEKAQTQDHSDPVLHVAADTMYRLYQVSLVVLLLGVVNFCLCPVGATIFVPTVICGFLYVLQGVHPRVRKVIRSSSP